MILPTKSEIIDAIKTPSNILDQGLSGYNHLDGIMDDPLFYSGGFGIAFPMVKDDEKYAFKIWFVEIEDIQGRLQLISNFLNNLSVNDISCFVKYEYVRQGLKVKSDEGEQLLDSIRMEWVEGDDLKKYIKKIVQGKSSLSPLEKQKLITLAEQFKNMFRLFHKLHISHGDLQHGNIIITSDDKIKLIDYDSLFVPALRDQKQVTSGLSGYQHPGRTKGRGMYTSEKDDYFSEKIIYYSLLILAEYPGLLNHKYDFGLVFTETDFDDFLNSQICKSIVKPDLVNYLYKIEQDLKSNIDSIKPLEGTEYNPYAKKNRKKTGVILLPPELEEMEQKRSYSSQNQSNTVEQDKTKYRKLSK